jgi:hypothetical protein
VIAAKIADMKQGARTDHAHARARRRCLAPTVYSQLRTLPGGNGPRDASSPTRRPLTLRVRATRLKTAHPGGFTGCLPKRHLPTLSIARRLKKSSAMS